MQRPSLRTTLEMDGETFVGSASGAKITPVGVELCVEFPNPMRVLPIGAALDTVLQALTDQGLSSNATARLVYQEQDGEGTICRLLYTAERMQYVLNLLNHRDAVRVQPRHDEPIQVQLADGVSAEVYDISTLGVSLLVTEDVQHRLGRWFLDFSLKLPGEERWEELRGEVVRRMLRGSALQYGIRFDRDACKDYDLWEARLFKYILDRQRDMIRERTSKRAG